MANARERDGPLGGGRQAARDRARGGRRSNEPTSHGVVPTRAPSRFFLLLRAAYQHPRSLGSSLFLFQRRIRSRSDPLAIPPACPSRAHIIHISTLMFFDYVVRRSTFSPIFLRLLPYSRNRPQRLAKLFEESCIAGPSQLAVSE